MENWISLYSMRKVDDALMEPNEASLWQVLTTVAGGLSVALWGLLTNRISGLEKLMSKKASVEDLYILRNQLDLKAPDIELTRARNNIDMIFVELRKLNDKMNDQHSETLSAIHASRDRGRMG